MVVRKGAEWGEEDARGAAPFIGEYFHSLDAKGRVIIPARLREAIDEEEHGRGFFVTRGLDTCLFVYTPKRWRLVVGGMGASSLPTRQARRFQRLFFSRATYGECDGQGRLLLPDGLREFAGLNKEVAIVGASDRIEIWDATAWRGYEREFAPEFEEIAEELFRNDGCG